MGSSPSTNWGLPHCKMGKNPLSMSVMSAEAVNSQLLAEIDAFLAREDVDLPVTTFGKLVMNDGKFVSDLRSGRRIWPETAARVREFMREYREAA